jgi:hypothetical protein
MDEVYSLPYARMAHPMYPNPFRAGRGEVQHNPTGVYRRLFLLRAQLPPGKRGGVAQCGEIVKEAEIMGRPGVQRIYTRCRRAYATFTARIAAERKRVHKTKCLVPSRAQTEGGYAAYLDRW